MCAVFIAAAYYLFILSVRPLHILVVDAVASKFFVAYFRAGAANSFAQANELRPTVMCVHVCVCVGKQINRRVRCVGRGQGAGGRRAAHKVTPHLTENHIKTR